MDITTRMCFVVGFAVLALLFCCYGLWAWRRLIRSRKIREERRVWNNEVTERTRAAQDRFLTVIRDYDKAHYSPIKDAMTRNHPILWLFDFTRLSIGGEVKLPRAKPPGWTVFIVVDIRADGKLVLKEKMEDSNARDSN